MTITPQPPPSARTGPGGLALGFLGGAVTSATLTGFISGCVKGDTPVIVGSLILPALTGLVPLLGLAAGLAGTLLLLRAH